MKEMNSVQRWLMSHNSPKYTAYYNGKMSYRLHGKGWREYVAQSFESIASLQTSENIFKTVIDLYAENLIPLPHALRGFSNTAIPLLIRGEAPVVLTNSGELHFPEHYEMISDGKFTVAALFTRSLETMQDYVTFIDSTGTSQLWAKDVPDDLSSTDNSGYRMVEELKGNILYRFALDDKGFGATLAALQDRVNHSIIDQTVIAEMYARPFWYLLNTELPVQNPYLPKVAQPDSVMSEQKTASGAGRIFTTSSEGPFGQLTPPTISDMVAYHDSIIDKVSQTTGIPQYYFKPGQGTPPTGIALKVMSKRFTNKLARMRECLTPELENICDELGLPHEVKVDGKLDYGLWSSSDDLLQDSMDTHGLALSQMGYPLKYIAQAVTPGVTIEDYLDDGLMDAMNIS